MSFLRPTFRVKRGSWFDHGKERALPPVTIAVLEVDTTQGLSKYEVLGCYASPVWVPTPLLAAMLRERGEQL